MRARRAAGGISWLLVALGLVACTSSRVATPTPTTRPIQNVYPTLVVARELPGGRENIEVLDTATGATKRILVPDLVLLSGNNLSRSAEAVAVAHYEGQPITWLDLTTGTRHDIPGGFDPALSPDGHSLAFWDHRDQPASAVGVTDLVTGSTRSVDITAGLGDDYYLAFGNGIAWLGPRRLAVVGNYAGPIVVGGIPVPNAKPTTTVPPHPQPRLIVFDPFAGSPASIQTVVKGPSTHQWAGVFADTGNSVVVADGPGNGDRSEPGELLQVDLAHPSRPPRPLAAIPPGDEILAVDHPADQVLLLTATGSLRIATIDAGRLREEHVIPGTFVAATWLAGS